MAAFTIRSLTGGAGTAYQVESSGITGARGFGVKAADTDRHFANGAVASRDYKSTRTITVPIIVRGTPASLGGLLAALEAAWAPSSVDIGLSVTTGSGTVAVTGRPRGLDVDDSFDDGTARCLAIFEVMGG